MKTLYALLIILLFAQIICDGDNAVKCKGAQKKNADECNKISPNEGDYRCCFVKAKSDDGNYEGCFSVTKAQYDDIDDAIETIEKEEGADIDTLDCGSNYIIIYIFIIFNIIIPLKN